MKIKLKKKKTTPKGDPVRQRNVADVQAETHRLMSAVDQKRKYATIKGLGQTADILRCAYSLIDLAEEG